MQNMVKPAMLLAAMTALFMAVGYLIGGEAGMLVALVAAAAMNLFSWWNSAELMSCPHEIQTVYTNVSLYY